MIIRISITLLFVIGIFSTPSTADTIYFKNGTRLDIESTWEENGKIKCRLFGNEVEYEKSEIERIERNENVIPIEGTKDTNDSVKKNKESPTAVQPSKESMSLEYHKEAQLLAEKGMYVEAIRKEKQANILQPDQIEILKALSYYHTMYAKKLFQRGQLESTLKYCHDALKYTPDYMPANEGISQVYVMYAQNAYDQRDFDSAEMYLRDAERYYDNNATLHVLNGKIAYDSGLYDEAKQEWGMALEINPQLDEAKMLLKKISQEYRVEKNFDEQVTGNFSVKYEGADTSENAEVAIAILNEAYIDVGNEMGKYPKHEIQVIIYPKSDIQELDYYPDMAAGLYDGKIRITEDLFNDENYLKAVLYHEYTHVLVHMIGGRNVPIWLNEGLAEYQSRMFKSADQKSQRKNLLKNAAKMNIMIPFNQLSITSLAGLKKLSYPLIALLYSQSDSFVTYLIDKFTINDIRTLLESLENGEDAQTAIVDIFNYSLEDLESEWKSTLLN